MPAHLENSAVATGLEKVSFHSNPKERKSQRMLKLPHSCTHLQFSSVAQSCLTFCNPWTAACQASLSITISPSSLRLTSIKSVMPSSHLILSRLLLLPPPIPPSIRVFSNESAHWSSGCLAIWSVVSLPFLKPAWTSGSSWAMYCWSLAWRILSITLLACEISAIVW